MIDLEEHAEEILVRSLGNGGDLAEIFLEESAGASILFDDGKVEKVVSGTEVGAGLRVLTGDRTLYAHTNDISREGLLRLAETVAGGVGGARGDYAFGYAPERFEAAVACPPRTVPSTRKLELVRAADAAARAVDPRVAQVTVRYADSLRRVAVVNSAGRFVEEERPQIILAVSVVARDGTTVQTGYHAMGGAKGYEAFEEEAPDAAAEKAARRACLMLDADPAPTGRMAVVLGSEAGGTMIHEAVGHGLEADLVDKRMSKYCGRLGETIAVPEVTVVDDGTLAGRRGTTRVDDEGTPTGRTVLVEDGRLVRFMNDLRTAKKMQTPPTGNGRRESYRDKPIPRMTNTMIAPGRTDPAEILASTESGLLVKRMGAGQVNTLNGEYVFEVTEGYLIRGGKAEIPVRGATLVGNGPETLLAIDAVGADLGFGLGTCGKQGQGAPVTHAQPTLRIRELTVGGTRQA